MDHDKLVKELNRIQDLMNELDPIKDAEKYNDLLQMAIKLQTTFVQFNDSCDRQLERQVRLDLDKKKVEKELEFKEKELEIKEKELSMREKEKAQEKDLKEKDLSMKENELSLREKEKEQEKDLKEKEFKIKEKELETRNDIEVIKIEDGRKEAAARRKAEKRQAGLELAKIPLQIIGTGLLIVLTGHVEQTAILGHNKWSLITKAGKF